jgi:hypothetical protein
VKVEGPRGRYDAVVTRRALFMSGAVKTRAKNCEVRKEERQEMEEINEVKNNNVDRMA